MVTAIRKASTWPLAAQFACTLTAVIGVFVLQFPLEERGFGVPFALFLACVFMVALVFGRRTGFLAVAASAALSALFFAPVGSMHLMRAFDLIQIECFAALAVGATIMADQIHRSLISLSDEDAKKTLLLREAAHRVANNFASLDALIRQRAMASKDPKIQFAFGQASELVHIVARLNSRLTMATGESVLNSQMFVSELCEDLRACARNGITINCRAESHDIPLAAAVPKAPPAVTKHQVHIAPANDRGAQSEQRADSLPAAKIKDREATVTPGQTTEPEVPPTEKPELGSPQTSTSTPPKAHAPNAASEVAPTPRTLATQRPSSVEDRQLMKALSAWETITDVVRTHLLHIRFLRARAGQALIGLGAILLAAAALLLAAIRRQQSRLVEGFVPRDLGSMTLGDNSPRDPGTSRRSGRLPLESAQYFAAASPATSQLMAGSAGEFSASQDQSTPSMPQEFVVRKQVIVAASQAEAFAIFTEDVGQWWPLATHHVGEGTPATAVLETFVNGRWFERAPDATEHDWGTVLAIEPPSRLFIAWLATHINPRALEPTEVEILFVPEGSDMIRVELEHRHLERYGDWSTKMYSLLDGDDGWDLILRRFAAACTVASYE